MFWRRVGIFWLVTAFWYGFSPAWAQDDVETAPGVVALAQLLAVPRQFEGQYIQTFGYVGGIAGVRLFLTKDHQDYHDSTSAVHLSIESAEGVLFNAPCAFRYVNVAGYVYVSEYSVISLRDISYIKDAATSMRCYSKPESKE